jgi:hypothetical protein
MSMGRDNVSALTSSAGPVFIPLIADEYGETIRVDTDRVKLQNSEVNLFQCHFLHHISHMDWPRLEPGPRR